MEPVNDNLSKSELLSSGLHKSKKTWRGTIILIIILFLGLIAGFIIYKNSLQKQEDLDLSPTEVENLEQSEQERVLNTQLKDLEKRAEQLNETSDKKDRFVVYIQLAEVLTALGKHDEALASLDKIKDENPGNTRLWMTYAQVYKNKGDFAQSKANIDMAMKIDDGIVDNWLFLFDISKDLSIGQQEAQYKAALVTTENDPKIQAAYDAWKARQ